MHPVALDRSNARFGKDTAPGHSLKDGRVTCRVRLRCGSGKPPTFHAAMDKPGHELPHTASNGPWHPRSFDPGQKTRQGRAQKHTWHDQNRRACRQNGQTRDVADIGSDIQPAVASANHQHSLAFKWFRNAIVERMKIVAREIFGKRKVDGLCLMAIGNDHGVKRLFHPVTKP